EIYAAPDGKVVGLKCWIIADLGAYHQLLTPAIPTLTALMIVGCYNIPNVFVETKGVFTNKMATDAYRGAGRPEATYIIERAMDLVAHELSYQVHGAFDDVRRLGPPGDVHHRTRHGPGSARVELGPSRRPGEEFSLPKGFPALAGD